MTELTFCKKGCCTIHTIPYKYIHSDFEFKHKFNNSKAGVVFYDSSTNKVLVVQSRGMKWGPPKGSKEVYDASIEDCAIREVLEETGIQLTKEDLVHLEPIRINRAIYYFMNFPENKVSMANIASDISGITWIQLPCLKQLCESNTFQVNSHCRKILEKLFSLNLV